MAADTLRTLRLIQPAPLFSLSLRVSGGCPPLQPPGQSRGAGTVFTPVARDGSAEATVEDAAWTLDGAAPPDGWGTESGFSYTLLHDFDPGERHVLACSCTVRSAGQSAALQAQAEVGCAEEADAAWAASCSAASAAYDETADPLLLYEYLAANGQEASDPGEAPAGAYRLRARFTLAHGSTPYPDTLPDGITFEMRSGGVAVEPGSAEGAWLESADYPEAVLDLRVVSLLDAEGVFLRGGVVLARAPLRVRRVLHPGVRVSPSGGFDAQEGGTWRDVAEVSLPGGRLEWPELHYAIDWYAGDTHLAHGAEVAASAAALGIGDDGGTAEVTAEAEERGALAVAADEDGTPLADADGDWFII